ncbi:uncharacterized protein LOC124647334 [Lolium rigidum]|uniref:uncharacterized protein LOC124647334 n=1 Tax=Lolium rigidum TaxID=89674 RepID=UPI001F5DD0EF|nr:uncharacterized protein LOC124647334 [Lolium rigidum]
MVEVAKIPRLDAEPKCFRVSRPTEDNIGLYFFPQGMRPNEGFDKLVKEVMDKNLILRAYVDEAEMLIFPSILLPERHQTFQGKHYLWGMFKRREDMVNAEGEQTMRGTRTGNGRQHCSRPCVGKKDVNKGARTNSLARPNESTPPAERTVAEAATPAPAADTATSNAPSRQAEHAANVVAEPVPAATSHAASLMLPADPVAADVTTTAPAVSAASSHAPSSSVSQRDKLLPPPLLAHLPPALGQLLPPPRSSRNSSRSASSRCRRSASSRCRATSCRATRRPRASSVTRSCRSASWSCRSSAT